MSPEFFVAMADDSNLIVSQQRILSKYLTYHFGYRVCARESEIAAIGSQFVPYEFKYIKVEDEKVKYCHRSFSDLSQHNSKTMSSFHIDEVEHVEIILGGDHGKRRVYIYCDRNSVSM